MLTRLAGREGPRSNSRRAHSEFRAARDLCYPHGRRTVTHEWLDKIDELGLAFWICDNAHIRRGKTKRTIYAFISAHAFSISEVNLLQQWLLDRWQLNSFLSRNNKKYGDRDCGWMIVVCGTAAERSATSSLLMLSIVYVIKCLHDQYSVDAVAAIKKSAATVITAINAY